ncbi:MAG: PspC domain-containing protein [Ilumatobacter sp.]|uniref:PspC domain-containing protein n=1 Tax=Ilumatobacter sp. TaxID=1967498 RepID=UPI003C734675
MTNESPTPSPSDGPDAELFDADRPDATSDEPSTDGPFSDEPISDGNQHTPPPPSSPPPPTPGAPPHQPPVRRLVRDPYTRLGGVASGIGHYTGLDTSIVRILFLITTLTGGLGLLVYLLAWLVIPRAEHWPPANTPVSYRNMTGRDLGLGLAVVGVLIAVGFGASGATGSILVPLALVAGGVWLLVQPPSTPVAATGGGAGTSAPFAAEWGPVGTPVPPPKRRRGRWLIAFGVVAAMLALLAIPVMIVLALAFGSLGDTTRFTPTTIDEIPTSFSEGIDRLEIDLSGLDADDFDAQTEPLQIDADIDLGSILVIVPDDISVSVDSTVDAGEITVFGDTVDGIDSSYRSTDASVEVDIEMRLDVDLGQIDVERP